MINKQSSNVARLRRHKRVRKAISGTPACPRLCVFRSLKNIYAQIIDDVAGATLVAASSLELEGNGGNKEAAKAVGELIYTRLRLGTRRKSPLMRTHEPCVPTCQTNIPHATETP